MFLLKRSRFNALFILIFSFVILFSHFSFSELLADPQSKSVEIGFEEHLGQFLPLDAQFYDEDSNLVSLGSLIADKPTVLSLVYYNCPGSCSPLLGSEVSVLDRLDLKPGVDYRVLTISFDPTETPTLAREKKQNYYTAFDKPFPRDAWSWVTGDSANIQKITEAVGFNYKKSGDGFIHATGLIILSPKGKVSRYLFGMNFLPFDLKMGIIEAADGKVGPTVARLLKLCFNYDPEGRRYVLNFLRIAGAFVILLTVIFVVFISFKVKRKERA